MVPKTATLFIHYSTNIQKEIMLKNLGSTSDDFAVEIWFLKHLVYIRAVAMHLRGEPFDRSALFVENRFDDMSYVEIRHQCIKIS